MKSQEEKKEKKRKIADRNVAKAACSSAELPIARRAHRRVCALAYYSGQART